MAGFGLNPDELACALRNAKAALTSAEAGLAGARVDIVHLSIGGTLADDAVARVRTLDDSVRQAQHAVAKSLVDLGPIISIAGNMADVRDGAGAADGV